jgi:inner membrane protein
MKSTSLKSSIGIRLAIIAFLSLVLLIPAILIQVLISERQDRRNEAIHEVFSKWGDTQTVAGPILSVPYNLPIKTEEGDLVYSTNYAHLLPDNLTINVEVIPEIRYRGIYEVVLYTAKLSIMGNIRPDKISTLNIPKKDLRWTEAIITIGISDLRGIQELVQLNWNSRELMMDPGIETKDIFPSGISTKAEYTDQQTEYNFSTNITLNGSGSLLFIPLGIETNVKCNSTWNNPSFTGNFLPDDRIINDTGFDAEWKILHLNRNFPQKWIGSNFNIYSSEFGIKFLIPVDDYQKTMRTAKYAIMFISFTFLSFFLIELLNRKVIHPIQYLLIGFSLLVFYTLLLSLSEQMTFNIAYILAGMANILLISAYTRSILKNILQTLIILGVLVILYGYLYVVLQLQDYALLMGSIGLFIVLAILMFITRKIDWFSILRTSDSTKISDEARE